MAEKTVLVCDVCGEPARQTVRITIGTRNLVKDLCERHLAELVEGARRPKRGRRPGALANSVAGSKKRVAAPRPKRVTRARRARRPTARSEKASAAKAA